MRYIKRKENSGPYLNFLNLVAESSASYFMWLADDDVLDPSMLSVIQTFLALHPDLEYLGWGFCVHNYVTGTTETPSALPVVLHSKSGYANSSSYLEMPISSYFYGLFKREMLLQSCLSRWVYRNILFDWMDVAFVMSTLLNHKSHFLSESLVTYGIHQLVRPNMGAAGLEVRQYDPFPWLRHGIMLILLASRLSLLQRIKLLPKFIYAWRNTSTFAINHS